MSTECETGAGQYHKSALVSTHSKVPFCFNIECKTPIMLKEGEVYGVNAPVTMVDPEAMDNLYRPWELGDGWAHSAILTCPRDTTEWTEPCEVFAVKDPGDCNGLFMEAVSWPEGMTPEELLKVRATSPCCWKWRGQTKANTRMPCPAPCVVEGEGEEK